jgi:hypothetical protein
VAPHRQLRQGAFIDSLARWRGENFGDAIGDQCAVALDARLRRYGRAGGRNSRTWTDTVSVSPTWARA